MSDEYRVVRCEHGVLIHGPVPIDDLVALQKGFASQGINLLDAGIAQAMHATVALVSKKSGAKWRAEIERANSEMNAEQAWLCGTDTGSSSLTIFSVLSEKHGAGALRSRTPDIPHDPDDFGRCHRLLEKFPAWRERLVEVADKHKKWAPLVDAWGELTALYVSEVKSGKAPLLYARMKSLRGAT